MKEALNILFLPSWYPNPDSTTNGIFIKRHAQAIASCATVNVVFAKAVKNNSSEQIIKTESENKQFNEYLLFYEKTTITIPVVSQVLKLVRYYKTYKTVIKKVLTEKKIDLVHLYIVFPAGIILWFLLKKHKIPYVVTEQWSGYYPEDGNYKGFFLKYITKKIVKHAKHVSVVSEKLKRDMLRHGLMNDYHLINNVVNCNVFYPNYNYIKKQTYTILHVSSLVDREKNITGIIETASELKKKQFDFQLIIIGENSKEIVNHTTLVKHYDLQHHIQFVGSKSASEIADYMRQADVFLLFSYFEGMPVVILEALACGLPIISTKVGAVPSLFKEEFGILLNTSIPNECANEIVNFSKKSFTDKLYLHNYIKENYSYKAVGETFFNLYQDALRK